MSQAPHRQLAAIMFTDIVGYTSIMQSSESTAVQIRQRHREVFESVTDRYGGQIIQYYGDGTLSIFNSTVKAVECAVELQTQMLHPPAVPLRIGIHTGDIILTDTDIIGDSVNLASRIESFGIAGSILISEKVADEIKNQDHLPVSRLGTFHLKNVEDALNLYALALPQLVVPKAHQLSGKGAPDKRTGWARLRTPLLLSTAFLIVLLLAAWLFRRQSNIRWATYQALPEIEELLRNSDYLPAFQLALKAEKYIPADEKLQQLKAAASSNVNIHSEPEGAQVYVKVYANPELEWNYLGVTPLEGVVLPNTTMRYKIENPGYETVYAAEPTFHWGDQSMDILNPDLYRPRHIRRKLDLKDSIPPGMIRIPGDSTYRGFIQDFFIDRFEVTNIQYKDFIDRGGYQDRRYWIHELVDEDKIWSWEEAMSRFVDQTGQPGPAHWEAGDFPKGQEHFPVGGISWYEAAAYAEYVGKSLPSLVHWYVARGGNLFNFQTAELVSLSNYNQQGPVPVGSLPGITAFGAYDMAGNVREWCFNPTQAGRLIRGGAWNDQIYSFSNLAQAPAFDRSPANGFRCAWYPEPDSLLREANAFISTTPIVHYELTPVADEIFRVYREGFDYDKYDQQPQTLHTDDTQKDWTEHKVAFKAAYGNEQVTGFLFLPKSSVPPYQVVIYWPGSGSVYSRTNFQSITQYSEFRFLDFIVKTGRAVFYPVYKGTFDRGSSFISPVHIGRETHESAQYLTMVVKDFRTSIDYLEGRGDIDTSKIALFGFSWGAVFGPVASAVDHRVKTSIFAAGGLDFKTRPEVFPLNYLPRVNTPTIMLNGRLDSRFSLENSVKPMFELLGCPPEDKKLVLYDSEHMLPRNEMIRDILIWLDSQLGPVNRLAE